MLTSGENELLTRVGPGTPAGELLRRYWHPIAISTDLSEEYRVKSLESLVKTWCCLQSKKGELGLLEDRCSHRGASLSYGRAEERGIACPYHGWLYDTKGNCLETPAEPLGVGSRSPSNIPPIRCKSSRGFTGLISGRNPRRRYQNMMFGRVPTAGTAARAAAARLQLAASDGKLRRYGASACASSRAGHRRIQGHEYDARHHRQLGQA